MSIHAPGLGNFMNLRRALRVASFLRGCISNAHGLSFALAMSLATIAPTNGANAGTIGADNRKSIEKYAEIHKADVEKLRKQFGATGRIMCPFGEASAFLVHKANIVLTARHNLFPEKEMKSYSGKPSIFRCGFELTDGKTSTWYEVDVNSFVYPEEKQRAIVDRFDWVVMRLTAPIAGVTPYRIRVSKALKGDAVIVSTIRQEGFRDDSWNARILGDCTIRNVVNIDDVAGSGLFTDCSANFGASGGALLRQTAQGLEAVGIMSSTSRKDCKKYRRKSCSSYAVGLSSDVAKAIRKLAAQ